MLTLLVLTMGIAISLSTVDDESHVNIKTDNANEHVLLEGEKPSFLLRRGRFLAQQFKVVRTCEVYPKLCRGKNSQGPNCCNKQCVNLMTDLTVGSVEKSATTLKCVAKGNV